MLSTLNPLYLPYCLPLCLQRILPHIASMRLGPSSTTCWHAASPKHNLLACSKSQAQLERAGQYYYNHLDGKVPVVVLSDIGSQPSSNLSATVTPHHAQHAQPGSATQHPAPEQYDDDDPLDSLLQTQCPDMFDLSALHAAVPAELDELKVKLSTSCGLAVI